MEAVDAQQVHEITERSQMQPPLAGQLNTSLDDRNEIPASPTVSGDQNANLSECTNLSPHENAVQQSPCANLPSSSANDFVNSDQQSPVSNDFAVDSLDAPRAVDQNSGGCDGFELFEPKGDNLQATRSEDPLGVELAENLNSYSSVARGFESMNGLFQSIEFERNILGFELGVGDDVIQERFTDRFSLFEEYVTNECNDELKLSAGLGAGDVASDPKTYSSSVEGFNDPLIAQALLPARDVSFDCVSTCDTASLSNSSLVGQEPTTPNGSDNRRGLHACGSVSSMMEMDDQENERMVDAVCPFDSATEHKQVCSHRQPEPLARCNGSRQQSAQSASQDFVTLAQHDEGSCARLVVPTGWPTLTNDVLVDMHDKGTRIWGSAASSAKRPVFRWLKHNRPQASDSLDGQHRGLAVQRSFDAANAGDCADGMFAVRHPGDGTFACTLSSSQSPRADEPAHTMNELPMQAGDCIPNLQRLVSTCSLLLSSSAEELGASHFQGIPTEADSSAIDNREQSWQCSSNVLTLKLQTDHPDMAHTHCFDIVDGPIETNSWADVPDQSLLHERQFPEYESNVLPFPNNDSLLSTPYNTSPRSGGTSSTFEYDTPSRSTYFDTDVTSFPPTSAMSSSYTTNDMPLSFSRQPATDYWPDNNKLIPPSCFSKMDKEWLLLSASALPSSMSTASVCCEPDVFSRCHNSNTSANIRINAYPPKFPTARDDWPLDGAQSLRAETLNSYGNTMLTSRYFTNHEAPVAADNHATTSGDDATGTLSQSLLNSLRSTVLQPKRLDRAERKLSTKHANFSPQYYSSYPPMLDLKSHMYPPLTADELAKSPSGILAAVPRNHEGLFVQQHAYGSDWFCGKGSARVDQMPPFPSVLNQMPAAPVGAPVGRTRDALSQPQYPFPLEPPFQQGQEWQDPRYMCLLRLQHSSNAIAQSLPVMSYNQGLSMDHLHYNNNQGGCPNLTASALVASMAKLKVNEHNDLCDSNKFNAMLVQQQQRRWLPSSTNLQVPQSYDIFDVPQTIQPSGRQAHGSNAFDLASFTEQHSTQSQEDNGPISQVEQINRLNPEMILLPSLFNNSSNICLRKVGMVTMRQFRLAVHAGLIPSRLLQYKLPDNILKLVRSLFILQLRLQAIYSTAQLFKTAASTKMNGDFIGSVRKIVPEILVISKHLQEFSTQMMAHTCSSCCTPVNGNSASIIVDADHYGELSERHGNVRSTCGMPQVISVSLEPNKHQQTQDSANHARSKDYVPLDAPSHSINDNLSPYMTGVPLDTKNTFPCKAPPMWRDTDTPVNMITKPLHAYGSLMEQLTGYQKEGSFQYNFPFYATDAKDIYQSVAPFVQPPFAWPSSGQANATNTAQLGLGFQLASKFPGYTQSLPSLRARESLMSTASTVRSRGEEPLDSDISYRHLKQVEGYMSDKILREVSSSGGFTNNSSCIDGQYDTFSDNFRLGMNYCESNKNEFIPMLVTSSEISTLQASIPSTSSSHQTYQQSSLQPTCSTVFNNFVPRVTGAEKDSAWMFSGSLGLNPLMLQRSMQAHGQLASTFDPLKTPPMVFDNLVDSPLLNAGIRPFPHNDAYFEQTNGFRDGGSNASPNLFNSKLSSPQQQNTDSSHSLGNVWMQGRITTNDELFKSGLDDKNAVLPDMCLPATNLSSNRTQ